MDRASFLSPRSSKPVIKLVSKLARFAGEMARKGIDIRLAPVHRLAKKKKQIELLELEQEIRTYVQDRDLAFCLGFNDHQDGLIIYENHHWLSEDDKHKAIRESSIWSLEIYGQGIEASLLSVVRFFRTCERVD